MDFVFFNHWNDTTYYIIVYLCNDEKAYTNQQTEFHDHGDIDRDVSDNHVDHLCDYQGFHVARGGIAL